jgi:hypothetical protein
MEIVLEIITLSDPDSSLPQNGYVDAEEIVGVATAILKAAAQKKSRERRKGGELLVKALAMLESPLKNILRDDAALGEAKIQELGDILITIGQVACQRKNWGEFLAGVYYIS